MQKIDVNVKCLEQAIKTLREHKAETKTDCYCIFNGKAINSTMSINECFQAVTGKNYFQYKDSYHMFEQGYPLRESELVDFPLTFNEMMCIYTALGFYKTHLTTCEETWVDQDDSIRSPFCSWLTEINENKQLIQNLYDKIHDRVSIQSIEEDDDE